MIYRGLYHIMQRLTDPNNVIAYADLGLDFIGAKQAGFDQPLWRKMCVDYLVNYDFGGFTLDTYLALGVGAPRSKTSTPMLVVEGRSAILLREYTTSDKGLLPVYALEMLLYPTLTGAVLAEARGILEANGIKYVAEGRPDSVILLSDPAATHDLTYCWDYVKSLMGSRVRKACKAAEARLSTEITTARTFVEMMRTGEGNRICSENALFQIRAATRSAKDAMEHDYANVTGYTLQSYRETAWLEGSPQDGDFRFFLTWADGWEGVSLVAMSVVYVTDVGEWYWIESHVGRSGHARRLRNEMNLTYGIITQLMEHAVKDDAQKFNLGISSFPYKQDFTDHIEWHRGVVYA